MKSISFVLLITSFSLYSCGKKYQVSIGLAHKNQPPYSYANPFEIFTSDIIITAKNDSIAYYKSVLLYLKKKGELEKSNSDTILLGIHEGQYIKGLTCYYKETGNSISLTKKTKENIEFFLDSLKNNNKLNLTNE